MSFFAADAVLLVAAHAVGAAAAEQQYGGHFRILAGMGVAQLAAHDESADIFVFFGGEIVGYEGGWNGLETYTSS